MMPNDTTKCTVASSLAIGDGAFSKKPLTATQEPLMTLDEVANRLGFTRQRLYDAIYRKTMPGLKWTRIGRSLRMHPDVLRAFIEAATEGGAGTDVA